MKSINKQVLNEFQSKRLIQARLAKKWTQPELADRVGLTRQAISSYENVSGTNPTPENLRKLSRWLEVPEVFFFTPLRESENKLESSFNFRTLKSKTRKARGQATSYLTWLVSLFDYVSDYVELPPVNIPDFSSDDFAKVLLDDIEDVTEKTRRFFGLGDGPISNLTLLLENNGVAVARVPLEAGIDGVSAWFNGRPVIIINSNAYYARSRFDLAHEFYHLIAHRHVTLEDLEDKHTLDLIETQAHRGAGAFLAPYKTFLKEVHTVDKTTLIDLKERWGISAQAIIMRLHDLGVISDHKKTRLFTQINAAGWRRKEPLDGVTTPEQHSFLNKVAKFFDSNNVLALEEFIIRSRMPEDFVEQVANIPKIETKQVEHENVIKFKPRIT